MHKKVISAMVLVWLWFLGTAAFGLELMLPQVYDDNLDIAGWLVSEKLDGVRGYWDGKLLLSKNGLAFHPPQEFLHNFPDFAVEGEIWGGRGTFEQTVGIVKSQQDRSGWLTVKFAIFDVPEGGGGFSQRIARAKAWFLEHPSSFAFVIAQKPVQGKDAMQEELLKVEKLGGEGLIVRRADALYSKGRSADIVKVKTYKDTEAVVVGHLPGAGKNRGRLGSLLVELPDGITFKIGTGFSDKERENPPPVGSTITFKYYGFYQSGIPKFPSYLRVRDDEGI